MQIQTKSLTAKQEAFLEAYTNPTSPTYNNQTQSAITAGYAPTTAKNAYRMILGNQGVQTALAKRKAQQKESRAIELSELIEECRWGLEQAKRSGSASAHARYLDMMFRIVGAYDAGNTTANTQPTINVHLPAGFQSQQREHRLCIDGKVLEAEPIEDAGNGDELDF